MIVCHTKEKAPHFGKKEEPRHRWHLCRGRSMKCLSDAAQKWSFQHWKGPKISSLSIFSGVYPILRKGILSKLFYYSLYYCTLLCRAEAQLTQPPTLGYIFPPSDHLHKAMLSSLMLINTSPVQGL